MSKFIKLKNNFIWQGIYQVIILLLGLVVPYIVINVYGSEVNGLTSTIKQVILLSSLASSGVTTAVTYTLYKPIQDNERGRIAGILMSVKKAYRFISLVTLVACIVGSIILAFFQKGNLSKSAVFLACFLTSLNTVLDLYFTATAGAFLTATQDKYIISIAMLISSTVMYGGQIIISILQLPFIFLYTTSLVGSICKIIFMQHFFSKKYKKYKLRTYEKIVFGDFKLSNVNYAFANEVAHTVNTASQSIIITFMYGLTEASVLSVYMMVVNSLSLLAQVVYTSFAPSYGAVVAEGDINKVNSVFEIFQQTLMTLNAFLYMCAIPLFLSFVRLYTGNVTDVDYVSKVLMIEAVLYGIFYAIRVPYNIVVSTNGIFKKSAIQTVYTCVFTIGIAIACAYVDYKLVLIGSIIFYAVNTFYQHRMLSREIKGFDNRHFWRHLLVTAAGIICMYLLSELIFSNFNISNFISWIILAFIVAFISLVLLLILSSVFDRKSLMKTIGYFKGKIKKGK